MPYNSYTLNSSILVVKSLDGIPWRKNTETGLFLVDKQGRVSPAQAPHLVFGVGHEVTYTFRPLSPFLTCLPCYDIAPEKADKAQCRGATSVSSLPGYMLLHSPGPSQSVRYPPRSVSCFTTHRSFFFMQGQWKLEVHACPSRAACPGSDLRLTGDGRLAPQTRLCAEGWAKGFQRSTF